MKNDSKCDSYHPHYIPSHFLLIGFHVPAQFTIMRTLALAFTFMMTDVVPAPRTLSTDNTKKSSRKKCPEFTYT